MKKLYIAAAALLATCTVSAQSQRMVLSEEFTQASCGPCALQNPAFDALLGANTAKVVVLKYQTSWPGVDPMNAQTQNVGVGTRVSYYGINGVPTGLLDGLQQIGSSYIGAPSNWSQSTIDTRYTHASPFTMNTSHVFNSTYDSVTVTVQLTCTQAVSASSLVLQLALVEKEIDFCAPPGTNGESIFYGVTRKMLPGGSGTSISNTWTLGQTQTWTFTTPLPSYVYDIKNFAVIAFVQDNSTFTQNAAITTGSTTITFSPANPAFVPGTYISGVGIPASTLIQSVSNNTAVLSAAATATSNLTVTASNKEVLQASISEPIPFPNYAILYNCSQSSAAITCIPSYNSDITITNDGSGTMTSCDINYNVDGGTNSVYNWTGNLIPGSAATITLPAISFTGSGAHQFNATCATVNGSTNIPGNYSSITESFTANIQSVSPPVTQDFVGTTFPPAGWGKNNPNNNATWSRYGIGHLNNGSSKMDYFNSPSGNVDDLYLPGVDLSGATSATLTFDVAKSSNSGHTDRLSVIVSTNCGATWTTMWTKNDPSLSTTGPLSSSFAVSPSSIWRNETVNLNTFLGSPNVLIAFRANSGNGNNAYLDNINLNTTVGLNDHSPEQQVTVYPSPTSGSVFVNLSSIKSNQIKITVTDAVGRVIRVDDYTKNTDLLKLDMSNQENGTYFIQIDTNGQRIIRKIILTK